jgi:tetratricopeptide (TPR) repeat protein
MTRSVLFPVLLAFAVFLSVPAGLLAAPKAASSSYEQVQVDGICAIVSLDLWNHVDAYFHAGDFPRAIALDKIITSVEPNFEEAYATGGWLMESGGDLSDAEAYYKEGVTNNPKSSYMYYQLGFFYFNTKHDYPMALQTFKTDVKTPDAEANDWKMLAHSYEKNGQISQAVSVWKTIKERYPQAPAVDYNLSKDLKLQAAQQGQSEPAATNTP